MKIKIKLAHKITGDYQHGQTAFASIFTCHGSEKHNIRKTVYRVSDFMIPGEKTGWKLMPREYTTLKSLLRTAKKNGMEIIEI